MGLPRLRRKTKQAKYIFLEKEACGMLFKPFMLVALRFFVVLAIVLARVLSRNPMLLVGEETAAYAILAIFLAETLRITDGLSRVH